MCGELTADLSTAEPPLPASVFAVFWLDGSDQSAVTDWTEVVKELLFLKSWKYLIHTSSQDNHVENKPPPDSHLQDF